MKKTLRDQDTLLITGQLPLPIIPTFTEKAMRAKHETPCYGGPCSVSCHSPKPLRATCYDYPRFRVEEWNNKLKLTHSVEGGAEVGTKFYLIHCTRFIKKYKMLKSKCSFESSDWPSMGFDHLVCQFLTISFWKTFRNMFHEGASAL